MFLTHIIKDCHFTGFSQEGILFFCVKAGIVYIVHSAHEDVFGRKHVWLFFLQVPCGQTKNDGGRFHGFAMSKVQAELCGEVTCRCSLL